MKLNRYFAISLPGLAALGLMLGSSLLTPIHVRADDSGTKDSDTSRIALGLAIAPVPLKLDGLNKDMVGLGSYLVNAQGDCNGCHTADPATEFKTGGNPYFGQHPILVNRATYLGGGQSFGALIPGSAVIVSRNLTPDKTGRPAGGRPLADFLQILKTGVDLDHLHPTCPGAPNANCIPPPFDGDLLQIMPWPAYSHLTDHDISAIYEYLSAIPCITGPPAPSPLHNDCN